MNVKIIELCTNIIAASDANTVHWECEGGVYKITRNVTISISEVNDGISEDFHRIYHLVLEFRDDTYSEHISSALMDVLYRSAKENVLCRRF